MANRYWVGGAGNWSSTTKWSTSSGGGSGASVPIATDDVIFDANSGLTTGLIATVDTAQICNNLTITPNAAVGSAIIAITASLTINGTLSCSGTAGNKRMRIQGTTYGLQQNLIVNAVSNLADLDFRDVIVTGTAAPISGTRIGDLRGCSGITFSTPKTVYWNLAGAQNWTADGWATTSTGTPSTDNFPLAQDTATFTDAGSVTGQITINGTTTPYVSGIDMSGRTSAMTLAIGNPFAIYGDWKNGSGTTLTGASAITFSGRNTQTITSAGKAFSGGITVDTYGGTVQLADAFSIPSTTLTVTNGVFTTNGFAVTASVMSSNNSNVRTINLGASTVTLTSNGPLTFTTSTNLTFNAGTSQITLSGQPATFAGGGVSFYNVSFTGTNALTHTITGANTFNNLTFTAPAATGLMQATFGANQIITGTLTCAGATAIRRIFLRSDTLGTQRDLTVGTLSATDCDFRDIDILGTAAGSSPTRAGDCGGNAGITFPAPKTVYWNLAGAQNWSATGWAPGSAGTPALNNFPLAQDTAVFDNAGSVTGTITIDAAWNIGTFDASLRTSAMTLTTSSVSPRVYGNWKFGTGVTSSSATGTIIFGGRGTQTITSNGVLFGCPITVDSVTGTVQLADALTLNSARALTINTGIFDAVSYNVTAQSVNASGTNTTLKMGSGTWTLSGTSTVWTNSVGNFYKGTADIVLSDTSTTARTFNGSSKSYNKLTIGGTTGTSTTTIFADNQFTELASTKTVAHTIALGTSTQTFGKWSVTGTVGNVVTLTGTGVAHVLAGAATSGIDYLAMGSIGFSATSPAEFYAGANSTGTAAAPVYRTATPTPRTVYWVGGTGTWDATTTTNWSTTSGSGSGAAVPTSLDTVVFNSASNATAYTVTLTATQLRCGALTIGAPASGALTFAGTAPLAIAGNTSIAASNVTRTYTGAITLSGAGSYTLTTNGVALASSTTVNGVGCTWSLGSALNNPSILTVTNGTFSTSASNYNVTLGLLSSTNTNTRTITLGSSTVILSGSGTIVDFSTNTNLILNAGTSLINCSSTTTLNFYGGTSSGTGVTFYNVSFSGTPSSSQTHAIRGNNTFNNLTIAALTVAGLRTISLEASQTINGTLTLSAGTDATMRTFVRSDTIGTTRTLTCAAVSATDADFRDITITGAAAPVSGTRLGDCKGNSGITFPAPKTVYPTGSFTNGSWGQGIWSTTQDGAQTTTDFPLAQDTVIITSTVPSTGGTLTINAAYNIGTINMSARTTNTMTLATGTTTPTIYGNWINGTGTTLTGTSTATFAGRGSQTITSAGKSFSQTFNINSPSGSVTLQDALNIAALNLTAGTFNSNNYNVSLVGQFNMIGANQKILAIGSSIWTIAGTGAATFVSATPFTVTGTGTISMTGASSKSFAGLGADYSGITLNQGGAGTLTITGNNTFANITSTVSSATSIALGATTQTVGNFTASGTAGNLLTITGTSAASPATVVYTGVGTISESYIVPTFLRVYPLTSTFTAVNSTNAGSLGYSFTTVPVVLSSGNFFLMFR